ncbi:TetR family transcriptional regulator [Nocardioides sp. GY 10127]|uniref:TetR/AcrR family transcriptional regulator n=1 Tax=Nocardioides sp. GY 10127 TaxID=2569762 RepID=UPI001981EB8B|nr:TetR family transcriptional regulator [Nocardioides sp. GY 10127]
MTFRATGDPRSARTVAALRRGLRALLSERPLDEVTVAELCRASGVRRTTFYTHVSSPAALLTDMLVGDVDALLGVEDADELDLPGLAAHLQRNLVDAFELVARERALFRAGLDSDSSAPLRRALLAMWTLRMQYAMGLMTRLGLDADDQAWAAVPFCAGGFTTALEAWALSDDTDSEAWGRAVYAQLPAWWPRA